jgi:2',3'-cyclic-nucleotide 2'-phosphodiesterase/3'-nucleotidase
LTARPRRPLQFALVALALAGLAFSLPGFAAPAKAKKKPARRVAAKAPARPAAAAPAGKKVAISVLHTTDLHGHLLSWDYETAKPVDDYGLARVATLIRRVREEPNVHTILVDAGDCIQGSPLADLHAVGGPERKPGGDGLPDPQMACMNALGYDAFAVGNHEYNFGLTVLERARAEAKFPWLSANTMKTMGGGAYQAYVVKEIEGVRVGILGLTTPGVPTWDDPAHYEGLQFDDPLETARHFVPILRGLERCDAVVIVCHMGLEENDQGRPSPGQAPNENRVLAIAREVPGVDAIVMGHTHTLVPSRTENGVLLTQAGRWGQALGRLDLTFEKKAASKWTLTDKRANLTRVDRTVPSDPAIEAIALPYHERAEQYLKTVIAQAAVPLAGADGRFRDNALLDLIHETQLEAGDADVSLAPMFNTRVAIPAGPVTVRDAFALYPYENTLAVLEVTGRDLKAALEHAAEYYVGYDFGRSDAPLVNSAMPGYNFDIAQGVSYTLDLQKPVGQRIVGLSWHGKPLSDDKKLKVAVSNYRVNGGGGYDMFKGKPVLFRSEMPTRDLLIGELRKHKTLTAAKDDNWRLVPAWVGEPQPARAGLELLVRRGIVPADSALAWGPTAPLTRQRYSAWLEKVAGPSARELLFPKSAGKLDAGSPVPRNVAFHGAVSTLPAALRSRFPVPQPPGSADEPPVNVGQGAIVLADVLYPRLTLLETTDFHGSLLQSARDRTTNRPIGGAAALATWLARERAKNPRRTLHLDGGDWMQGTPVSNLNFGRPVIAFFNRLGTDAAVVGNHEFDWTVDTLRTRMSEARFQPLAANWIERATGKRTPGVAPWTILERDGLRIGVIGILTDKTATVTLPLNVKDYEFPNGGAMARAFADSARAAGADLIVVVGHLPGTIDSTGTVKGELADIARAVGGPDGAIAVLGGHSHNRLNGLVDGMPVMISGSHGTTLGRMDFVIDRATRRPIPEETRRQLLTVFADEPRPDSTIAAFVDSANARLLPLTSRVLGRSKDALTRNRTGESSLGAWVADAMRAASGADFAFQNPGGLRADLDAGDVTMGDVYEVMPFDNQIATVTLTGAQVLDLLEQGMSPTSMLQFSGLNLVIDPKRPRGERVLEARLLNGNRLDPGARYKVATNDFMAQGGDGYTTFAEGEGLKLPGLLMRDLLIADVEKHGKSGVPLEAPKPGRIVNTSATKVDPATSDANR